MNLIFHVLFFTRRVWVITKSQQGHGASIVEEQGFQCSVRLNCSISIVVRRTWGLVRIMTMMMMIGLSWTCVKDFCCYKNKLCPSLGEIGSILGWNDICRWNMSIFGWNVRLEYVWMKLKYFLVDLEYICRWNMTFLGEIWVFLGEIEVVLGGIGHFWVNWGGWSCPSWTCVKDFWHKNILDSSQFCLAYSGGKLCPIYDIFGWNNYIFWWNS